MSESLPSPDKRDVTPELSDERTKLVAAVRAAAALYGSTAFSEKLTRAADMLESTPSHVAEIDFVCLKEPRCKAPCGERNCHIASAPSTTPQKTAILDAVDLLESCGFEVISPATPDSARAQKTGETPRTDALVLDGADCAPGMAYVFAEDARQIARELAAANAQIALDTGNLERIRRAGERDRYAVTELRAEMGRIRVTLKLHGYEHSAVTLASQVEGALRDLTTKLIDAQKACMRAWGPQIETAPSAMGDKNLLDEAGKFFDWGNAASVAMKNLLDAYERRIRSLCTTEQLELKPWECAEFVVATRILDEKPNWVIDATDGTANTNTPKDPKRE